MSIPFLKKPLFAALLLYALPGLAHADVLYSSAGPHLVSDNAAFPLPGLSLSRGATATGTLYFKYTVTHPASNSDTESYYAGMSFYDGGQEHLGIGNGWDQHAYSTFGTVGAISAVGTVSASGIIDLNSATPEPGATYQKVRSTDVTTFVIRVDFNSGANDTVTVWLNPNLSLSEGAQDSALTTTFTTDANFDTIFLREGGNNGGGWTFSDIAIAEKATDRGFFAVPVVSDVGIAAAGLVGDDIGLFVPKGLDARKLPYSFALVAKPSIKAPLPRNWRISPSFSRSDNRFRASVTVPEGTDLYGGGEVTGPLRRNGTSIKLWNTDNFTYQLDGGRRLYQSHPWIMGVRPDGTSFGVLFDSTWKAELSCSKDILFSSQGPEFPVLVIDRDSPQAVLEGLAELTGTMPLPPRWTLGYHQCRFSYNPDSRVREIASEFRKRQIPCDVIWMDIDYMDGYRVFTFDPKQFPDPKKLNADLHAQGFHSIWMIDPGVKAEPGYSIYDSGRKNDGFVKTAAGEEYHGKVWPGACAFPDFTRPDVRTWWAGLYKPYMATGIDGVWNDMNEPSVFDGPDGTMPEDNRHEGGGELPAGPHLQYHNVYGMLMVKASREGILAANPDKRPFVLTRSNFIGGQRYAATWAGDNVSSDAHMRLSVPMSLTLGLSGQPMNGPDLGGFAYNLSADLWAKWVGVGSFFPFCRGHAGGGTNNKEPWAFGPDVEKTSRVALERRYRLLPYLYTLFEQSSHDGQPVMRPVFFADPKDASLRAEEQAFLIGGDLLVVPRWAKDPKLPKGGWPEVSLVPGDNNDPNQASLRIRPGAIIPLGKVVQNTTEKSLDPLTLMVCPDAAGNATGSLYEDAGNGYGYQTGDFRRTTFRAQTKNRKVTVTVAKAEGKRPPECPNFAVQVVSASPPPVPSKSQSN